MKVTTSITKKDMILWHLTMVPKNRSIYRALAIFVILTFFYTTWKHGYPQNENDWFAAILVSVVGGIFFLSFGVIVTIISILRMSTENNGILGAHEYAITQEGLQEKTLVNDSLNRWEGITSVFNTGKYLFFKIASNQYHIVPAKSFESHEKYNEFVAAAKEYWHKANEK